MEKLEHQHEADQIRLLEELRKEEERLSARKARRDEEVIQLKQYLSNQLDELKKREEQSGQLHQEETDLKEREKKLQMELSKLKIHSNQRNETAKLPNNLRHIKMQLRNLSDTIIRDLRFHTDLLDRLSTSYRSENQQIARARAQFEMQYDLEKQKQQQVEAMYDSEVKVAFFKQHEAWRCESQARETILFDLFNDQMQQITNELSFLASRQQELIELRDSHRRAIDSANERIKSILSANSIDDRQRITSAENSRKTMASNNSARCPSDSSNDEICLPDLFAKSVSVADSIDSPLNSNRPRFGRKKIAWN